VFGEFKLKISNFFIVLLDTVHTFTFDILNGYEVNFEVDNSFNLIDLPVSKLINIVLIVVFNFFLLIKYKILQRNIIHSICI
jgi:hypothetical protein